MYVHVFGAYFGLAAARVLYSEESEDNGKEGPVYHSDLFSIIGQFLSLSSFYSSFFRLGGGAALIFRTHFTRSPDSRVSGR